MPARRGGRQSDGASTPVVTNFERARFAIDARTFAWRYQHHPEGTLLGHTGEATRAVADRQRPVTIVPGHRYRRVYSVLVSVTVAFVLVDHERAVRPGIHAQLDRTGWRFHG